MAAESLFLPAPFTSRCTNQSHERDGRTTVHPAVWCAAKAKCRSNVLAFANLPCKTLSGIVTLVRLAQLRLNHRPSKLMRNGIVESLWVRHQRFCQF